MRPCGTACRRAAPVRDQAPHCAASTVRDRSERARRSRHVGHSLAQFLVDAGFLGGLVLGPGDRIVERFLDLGLAHDDEPGLTRVDEAAELLAAPQEPAAGLAWT